MDKKVRVRFAPSPTGGLHLGGVRTVLYNYLFAKKHGGDFVLRIEDTDQTRYVPGAEDYILNCLEWCGLVPDESPKAGGPYAPYRQSERKPLYKQYALQLVEQGNAYYAFDTPEDLEKMRNDYKTEANPSPTYNHELRGKMRNSLTLPADEVKALIDAGTPYVIRIKMPENETVSFTDLIRGEVNFHTSQVDDKVLLKADGMPTYHLAVVVDDYLMKISHAFRGEEWLSSAPVHVLTWKYLGWYNEMPQWAHLPLILGPDGAKLSKRHGNKYGFPIFAMNWTDAKGDFTEGFRERGFLPEAFTNLLALMGWNPGNGQEILSLEEMISLFDLSRVHSAGAQFDFEKAKWFNHEWIKKSDATVLVKSVKPVLEEKGILINDEAYLAKVIDMVKERCTLLGDFYEQAAFFFTAPATIDTASILPKWNADKVAFFEAAIELFNNAANFNHIDLEAAFKALAAEKAIKIGELMMPLRIMLVGGKFGPGVFEIAEVIGKEETISRIQQGIKQLA
ncbi:glutamate--tRNA ligase [Polluticaenibacter yanchengensis]|uniref:Glutamate--tRNA ligase n=1 Tax=Polluticaenibacter yanchengensis TaxID=3014562 RepID=A0ABT4UM01_9BACT|nr:glutamate--tRNA ligase [Chitinophagaceae bacterium LY-5]